MSDPAAIIRYLRRCYEADNRAMAVGDLLHKSIRHLRFFEGDEHLVCGLLTRTPVDREAALRAMKEAQLHRREKTLLYCALPLIGVPPDGNVRLPKTLCAPLLFYPAKLVDEGLAAFVEVDLRGQRVNLPILAALLAGAGGETPDEADIEELLDAFPQAPLAKDDVQGLIALLQDFFPQIDALGLAQFPKLQDEKQVRRAVRRADNQPGALRCLPACALCLAPNSPETRGVLFELAEMAGGAALSAPLQVVLGGATPTASRHRPGHARVPAVLSRAQQRVVASAAVAPLTMVVGPPGTGKSYTIAAAAVDHLSRGESVLIACRKPQAVDVVAGMVERLLGPNRCVIRGGEHQHRRQLKQFLEHILQGIRRRQRMRPGDASPAAADRQLKALDARLARLERRLQAALQDEIDWGRLAADDGGGLLRRAVRGWRRFWLQRRLKRAGPLWHRVRQYQAALREANQRTRDLLKARIDAQVDSSLKRHRRDLTRFLQSLRTRSSTRQQALFGQIDPRTLFGTFPVWLTTIADASQIVPLEREVFDVAIFDEATQCDAASSLPILQRAKRAMVVGDPNQLRHISFLSRDRQQRLAEDEGLSADEQQRFNFRDKSLLDVLNEAITTQDHVHFLDEHFRSLPQIIRFSNERIYDGALAIMRLQPKTAGLRCVFPAFVAGGVKQSGANRAEAAALVDRLAALVDEQAALPDAACQSLGVLSPFRDQVDLISAELERRLPLAAFERHDLQVGTAHAFQGDERDVMFLSWVVDAQAHHASLRFVNNPNLFNVAVTRARHQQYVFYSTPPAELPASLLREYLEYLDHEAAPAPEPAAGVADAFLDEVRGALCDRRAHVWPEFELAGVLIDLVAERGGGTLGIDLVGYPGPSGDALDLERYRVLQRAGLELFPLPYSRWQQDRPACLAAIDAWLAGA